MRAYILVSGTVLALVTLAHILRVVFDWPLQVAGWTAPMWLSWAATPLAGALSLWAFRLAGRAR